MFIPRLLETDVQAALKTRKILFLLGARQVGKTTLMEHIFGKRGGTVLNMDTVIDRTLVEEAHRLEPHAGMRHLTTGDVLVIDEAQRLKEIGEITKSWYDAKVKTKVVLLGSASANLLDMAAAELVGRNEKLWLTPLLWREIVAQQSWWREGRPVAELQVHFGEQLQALLLQRLVFGSYPEAYTSDDPRRYLMNLSSDYLLKDIFTRSVVRSPEDVRRLLFELAQRIGETVSVMQLATRLKLSRQTVQRYLDLLEGIFVIFSLPAYATDPEREVNKSQKYYFWDTGVKNALLHEWTVSEARSDIDALWENWVVAEFAKRRLTLGRHEDLFFWRSRHRSSVELLIREGESLRPFHIRFRADEADPSAKSFERAYGVTPTVIHRNNVAEHLL